MTLEQILKERREAFNKSLKDRVSAGFRYENPSLSEDACEWAVDYLVESIRIAYEAGQTFQAEKDRETYRKANVIAEKRDYRAGLERAKVLRPIIEVKMDVDKHFQLRYRPGDDYADTVLISRDIPEVDATSIVLKVVKAANNAFLFAIDDEIAKNTPSQLSERDTDWCGLSDENARAKSDEV